MELITISGEALDDSDLQKILDAAMADVSPEDDFDLSESFGDMTEEMGMEEAEAELMHEAPAEAELRYDAPEEEEMPERGPNPDIDVSMEDLIFTLRHIASAVIDLKDQLTAHETMLKQIIGKQGEALGGDEILLQKLEAVGRQLDQKIDAQAERTHQALSELGTGVEENRRRIDGLRDAHAETAKVATAPRLQGSGGEMAVAEDLIQTVKQHVPATGVGVEKEGDRAEAGKPRVLMQMPNRNQKPRLDFLDKKKGDKPASSSGEQDFGADTANLISPFKKSGDRGAETSSFRNRAEGESTATIVLAGRSSRSNGSTIPPPAPPHEKEDEAASDTAPAAERTTATETPRRLSMVTPPRSERITLERPTISRPAIRRTEAGEKTDTDKGGTEEIPAETDDAAVPEESGPRNEGDVPVHPVVAKVQRLVFNFKIASSQLLKSKQIPRGGKLDAEIGRVLAERSNSLLRESLTRHGNSLAEAQRNFLRLSASQGLDPQEYWGKELLDEYIKFRTHWFVSEVLDKVEKEIRKRNLEDHWPLLDALAMEMELGRVEVKPGVTVFDPRRHQTRDGETPRTGELYQIVVSGDFKAGYVDLSTSQIVRKAVVRTTMVAKNV